MITRSTAAMDEPLEPAAPRSRRLGLVLGALGVVAAVAVAPAALRSFRADRAVDAARVRTAAVSRGDLRRDLQAQGRIVAARQPTLYAPAQGVVTLVAKAGAEVKRGALLARVASPELRSRFAQEQATWQSLRSDLARQELAVRQAQMRGRQAIEVAAVRQSAAERAVGRSEALFAQGLLNRTENEKAQDDLAVARLELQNAKEGAGFERDNLQLDVGNRRLMVERQAAVVRELQRLVDALELKAPFDGMVASVAVRDQEAVAPNQPVLTVVDLSAFEVEFDLPENYAADATPGTQAEIVYEGKSYPGRVSAISPEVRDSIVKGTLAFEPGQAPTGLRQSQRVTTRLVFETRPGVLKLPRGPFLEAGAGRMVYVVEDGIATRRAIETGASSVSEVEVVSGLREGDEVVISDPGLFQNAQSVLIR